MQVRSLARQLRRSPAFAIVAILSLAIGIGANTAIFSVMDALLFRQLPVERPEELVRFGDQVAKGMAGGFPRGSVVFASHSLYDRFSGDSTTFSGVAALASLSADGHGRLGNARDLEPMTVQLVSGNFFRLLGVRAQFGRLIDASDDRAGADPVMVASAAFARRRFGSPQNAVGRQVTFQGLTYTIVGVSADGFAGLDIGSSPDYYTPLVHQPKVLTWIGNAKDDLAQYLVLIGRRRPGVSLAQAQSYVTVAFQQWLRDVAARQPAKDREADLQQARLVLVDGSRGFSQLRQEYTEPLWILLSVVGIVLLIACANLANLLLARASGRQREMAVRLALGARRRELLSQVLQESMLLALAGGLAGVLLAWWGAQLLLALVETGAAPIVMEVGPNPRVLLFNIALSLLTGLIFGAVPAWRMTRVDPGPALQEGKGTAVTAAGGWAGKLLVAGQVALALLLTTGAGLYLRSLLQLREVGTGFRQDPISFSLNAEETGYKGAALVAWGDRLEQRVRALPGVQSVGFSMLHFGGGRWAMPLFREGVDRVRANRVITDGNQVSHSYFETLGIQRLRGRVFSPADNAQATPVMVVNQALARKLYPDQDALGRRAFAADGKAYTIVGVVADTRVASLREPEPRPLFFLHSAQQADGFGELLVRGGSPGLIRQVREAVRAENPNVAIGHIATLRDFVDETVTRDRVMAQLATFFGALALTLAAIGLYGVLTYAVARRTGEIGLRMALGARPGDVLRLVLGESAWVMALGLAMGVLASLAAGRLIQAQLYGVVAKDPVVMASSAAVLLVCGLAAAALPAWRAIRLDPIRALRQE